jgi:hypothetical protein
MELIALYCAVCKQYDTTLTAITQRNSNNRKPKFSDAEAVSIYLFGINEGKTTVKSIYRFIIDYYEGWFPALPSYQAFNNRLCNLVESIRLLCGLFIDSKPIDTGNRVFLMDSVPIIVAGAKRSNTARAAKGLCDKGYCASKKTYYYGPKLHVLHQAQPNKLPKMCCFEVTPASVSDITAAKEMLTDAHNIDIYADKAYIDKPWHTELSQQGVVMHNPVKLKKGQRELSPKDKLISRIVSSVRQPIESFFNWINEKTHIQNASKVRSVNGLISFIFARIAAAAFFYS